MSPKKSNQIRRLRPWQRIYKGMHKTLSSLLVVGLIGMGLAAASSPRPVQVYNPAAEKVRQVLEELSANSEKGHPASRTYQLSQTEINAYLLDELRHQEESAIESVSVILRDGGFLAIIGIDPDRLQLGEVGMTGNLLGLLFEGKQTLEIEGRLHVNQGNGTYQVERVRFQSVTLPIVLIDQILSSLGQGQNPPLDLTSGFPMPYGIRSVIVSPGQVVIKT